MQAHEAEFEHRFIAASDGLYLYVRDYRPYGQTDTSRPPVVCLPGLTRNCRDFHRFAVRLSSGDAIPRRVITMDYRGRGRSGRDIDKSRYQLPVEAQDVVTVCAALGIARADFIGTSRGGLILHLLGASHPELLECIVLNDIGPVIETIGLLTIRDNLLAGGTQVDWSAAKQTLKAAHGSTFPALKETDWADMAHALFRSENDAIIPDFDPALIEPLMALQPDTILPDLWASFERLKTKPLMTIRGEHSAILSIATVNEMADRHPSMRQLTAFGQGHAPLLHLDAIFTAVSDFLAARQS